MTVFNLRAIQKKMKSKPKGTDIYKFFEGANVLTAAQIDQIEKAVDDEVTLLKNFLTKQRNNIS